MRGILGRARQGIIRLGSWWATATLATRLRKGALAASLLAGGAYFLDVVNDHYKLKSWLFQVYAGYWGLTALFNAACFSTGYVLLRVLMPRGLPLRERVVLSMAVGVLAFYLGTFLAGLAHLFGLTYFLAFPSTMVLVGALPLIRRGLRLRRALRAARRVPARRWTLLGYAIAGFAALALGVIYLSVLTPENVSYDARFYHLPLAEHYAAVRGVEAFPEGRYYGALPHLASILYTWAMLWSWVHVVDRVLLCSHIEWSLFLWTLYGVTVLARRMVPRRNMGLAWVAVFLFPIVFVYDSNLNTGADHIAAFWAAPIYLAFLRVWPRLEPRASVLLGAMLTGAIATKYQGVYLAVLPCIAVALRVAWLLIRPLSRPRLMPLASGAAAALTVVVLWAPHWLKNLVWYGDPLYPLMRGTLHAHPWTADTDVRFFLMSKVHIWRPEGATLGARLLETLKVAWSFSFIPHDWGRLDKLPVFGSLFTLLALALPFLRARWRLWALFLAANVGILVWYWSDHQDRYLQALLPWFATCTAAAIALAWDSGVVPRLALIVLVGSQVVWGGDAPFIHSHRMVGESQLKIGMDRITSGFDHKPERRTGTFGDLADIGSALSPSARILVHEEQIIFGLQHPTIVDAPDVQAGISYGRFRTPGELDDRLRSWGVTHIALVTGKNNESDALPGDIVFYDYVTQFARKWKTFGGWTVYELPAQRPPDQPYGDILWLGCDSQYKKGRYAMTDMVTPFTPDLPKSAYSRPRAPVSGDDQAAIDDEATKVGAVGFDPNCQKLRPAQLNEQFTQVTVRQTLQVWVRRRGTDPN